MSWRCSSNSNEGLITNLWGHGLVKHESVKLALEKVDRAHFSPTMPYEDSPQRIGYDATISGTLLATLLLPAEGSYVEADLTPNSFVAGADGCGFQAVEALLDRLGPGKKVLDIGCGSGYLTAVFAHLVTPGGKVVGVEHIQQLCDMGVNNLKKNPVHAKMLEEGSINIIKADGRLGYPECGPYDAIHIGAAASKMHENLIDQLNTPGRMFIPIDNGFSGQYIWVVDKDKDGTVSKEKQYGVMYVPLTDAKIYKDEL